MNVDRPDPAGKPKLLEVVRERLRAGCYSLRTEEAYVGWIRRLAFHGRRRPRTMGTPEVTAFVSDLAVTGNVSASTQNQAFSAVLFLYGPVLEQPLGQSAGGVGEADAQAARCPHEEAWLQLAAPPGTLRGACRILARNFGLLGDFGGGFPR